jgi:hypothetical protein
MSQSFKEIWTLCDLLEAEVEGHPYDRKLAATMANDLAKKYPGIKKSMSQICERASQVPQNRTHA